MAAALATVQEAVVRAMLATVGATVAERLALTAEDVAAIAAAGLDESRSTPRDVREAAERWGHRAAKRRVLAWNSLRKALAHREASATAAGGGGANGSVLKLAPGDDAVVAAAVAAYCAAEVKLLGVAGARAALTSLSTPERSAAVVATDPYVLARDTDGTVTVALRGTVRAAAGGASAAARPGSSPLDAVAPVSDALLGGDAGTAAAGGNNGDDTGAWEANHMRRALTEPGYLLSTFKLPDTPDTRAAAVRVVDSFRSEADGRVAVPHPVSVDEIMARLGRLAAAEEPAARASGTDAAFARSVLRQMESSSPAALRAVHAMIVAASQTSLRTAMRAEFRAAARLGTGETSLETAAAAGRSAAEIAASLGAPLPRAAKALDVPLAERRAAREAGAARAAELRTWLAALPGAYESGLHGGVLGDVMRRRFDWFKAPYESWDGGEGLEEDSYVAAQERGMDELAAEVESAAGAAGTAAGLASAQRTAPGRILDLMEGVAGLGGDAVPAGPGGALAAAEWAQLKSATKDDLARWVSELDAAAAAAAVPAPAHLR